ncbi:hypothetical protein FISHEDRAFT_73062 [Fistulina hepatica ATCC 64428]|uniref:CCHC-type domain-containing protein n=1 Tax=Fistulina hepatica ATCC 64428 TaxID=1128425 RepID=A0A0D7ADP7_9AGAR|nr:hypothetical protein FISHEDRAFT_73062 [Fistulina hepatica ATCC 64428]
MSIPWTEQELDKEMKELYNQQHFDAVIPTAEQLGIDPPEEDSASDTESDYSDDDSDSEEEYRKSHHHFKKHKKKSSSSKGHKQPITISSRPRTPVPPTTSSRSKPQSEIIEGMIKQLNSMSISDPEYGAIYYRTLSMDTTGYAVKCITRQPLGQGTNSNSTPNLRSRSSGILNVSQPPQKPPYGTQCFGCNGSGHRVPDCPELIELEGLGLITRSKADGRWVHPSGQFISRAQGETLAEAIHRANPSRVHAISCQEEVDDYYGCVIPIVDPYYTDPSTSTSYSGSTYMSSSYETHQDYVYDYSRGEESDEDIDEPEVYMIPQYAKRHADSNVWPAKTSMKQTQEARKEVMSRPLSLRPQHNAHIPSQYDNATEKPKNYGRPPTKPYKWQEPVAPSVQPTPIKAPTPRPPSPHPKAIVPSTKALPSPSPSPAPSGLPHSDPIPVDARQPRFKDYEHLPEDIVMADVKKNRCTRFEDKKSTPQPQPSPDPKVSHEVSQRPRMGRTSRLSASTDITQLADAILDVQVPMHVSDILGALRELSAQLEARVKPHNPQKSQAPHTYVAETYNNYDVAESLITQETDEEDHHEAQEKDMTEMPPVEQKLCTLSSYL